MTTGHTAGTSLTMLHRAGLQTLEVMCLWRSLTAGCKPSSQENHFWQKSEAHIEGAVEKSTVESVFSMEP